MTLEEECRLSYYTQVAAISEDHEVFLVQHTLNNQFFVKKALHYYNLDMLRGLKEHPISNMPRIYELFEESPVLYVIEEYISGTTLEELLTDKGVLDESLAVSYIKQLCDIVSELHNCNPPIIHRDIKPSNIIITPDGTVKLLDLSAAKLSSEGNGAPNHKNQDTIMMGTAGYAAPEQYGFASSSTLTDIYAIGVLMNRMLTGEMLNVRRCDGHLASIIDKCTQLNPNDRFQNISELVSAISKAVAPEAECPKPESTKSECPDYAVKNNKNILHSYLRFFPPGLRSGKLLPSLLALAGYVLLFSITLSIESKDPSPRALYVNRIGATLAFLSVIFFSGNYLGCQSLLPLSKSENKVIKSLGIIIWNVVIFLVIVLLITLLEG